MRSCLSGSQTKEVRVLGEELEAPKQNLKPPTWTHVHKAPHTYLDRSNSSNRQQTWRCRDSIRVDQTSSESYTIRS